MGRKTGLGLAAEIDKLGALRERISALKAAEETATAAVTEQLRGRTVKRGHGRLYVAALVIGEQLRIEPEALLRAVGRAGCLACCRVNVADAKAMIGDDAARRIGQATPVARLSVERFKLRRERRVKADTTIGKRE